MVFLLKIESFTLSVSWFVCISCLEALVYSTLASMGPMSAAVLSGLLVPVSSCLCRSFTLLFVTTKIVVLCKCCYKFQRDLTLDIAVIYIIMFALMFAALYAACMFTLVNVSLAIYIIVATMSIVMLMVSSKACNI